MDKNNDRGRKNFVPTKWKWKILIAEKEEEEEEERRGGKIGIEDTSERTVYGFRNIFNVFEAAAI